MPRNAAAYDADFYAWSMEQAQLLRTGQFNAADIENIAEEIESLGRSDRRALDSRLIVLIVHLLKWHLQPRHRSPGWVGTIREQRRRVSKLLRESPSLQGAVAQLLPEAYADARESAANDTGLPVTVFPAECPFTPEQILAEDFLPED